MTKLAPLGMRFALLGPNGKPMRSTLTQTHTHMHRCTCAHTYTYTHVLSFSSSSPCSVFFCILILSITYHTPVNPTPAHNFYKSNSVRISCTVVKGFRGPQVIGKQLAKGLSRRLTHEECTIRTETITNENLVMSFAFSFAFLLERQANSPDFISQLLS